MRYFKTINNNVYYSNHSLTIEAWEREVAAGRATEVADELGNPLSATQIALPFGVDTGSWSVSTPVLKSAPVKQNIDEKEQRLRAKILPEFRKEALCDHWEADSKLMQAPKHPWFGPSHERTVQSKKAIKRWVSTNFKDWPVCRHSGEPCDLEFYTRDEQGGDGQFLRVKFICRCFR